ncbi:hypothetical protein Ciccas_013259 [Cichlidogyrus casuarinus]|uniref:Trigger factor n=1 Tax=Cichlidogyrus casuarinus TaxID=1844966 RepID=A0ABD2PMV2_9PLAT
MKDNNVTEEQMKEFMKDAAFLKKLKAWANGDNTDEKAILARLQLAKHNISAEQLKEMIVKQNLLEKLEKLAMAKGWMAAAFATDMDYFALFVKNNNLDKEKLEEIRNMKELVPKLQEWFDAREAKKPMADKFIDNLLTQYNIKPEQLVEAIKMYKLIDRLKEWQANRAANAEDQSRVQEAVQRLGIDPQELKTIVNNPDFQAKAQEIIQQIKDSKPIDNAAVQAFIVKYKVDLTKLRDFIIKGDLLKDLQAWASTQ